MDRRDDLEGGGDWQRKKRAQPASAQQQDPLRVMPQRAQSFRGGQTRLQTAPAPFR